MNFVKNKIFNINYYLDTPTFYALIISILVVVSNFELFNASHFNFSLNQIHLNVAKNEILIILLVAFMMTDFIGKKFSKRFIMKIALYYMLISICTFYMPLLYVLFSGLVTAVTTLFADNPVYLLQIQRSLIILTSTFLLGISSKVIYTYAIIFLSNRIFLYFINKYKRITGEI